MISNRDKEREKIMKLVEFEEKFSELKTEFCNCEDTSIEDLHIHKSTIEKYCLSKQRVREAIQKVNKKFSDNKYASDDYPGADTICDKILTRLGLEK